MSILKQIESSMTSNHEFYFLDCFSVHRTGSQWLLWSQTGGSNSRFISSQDVATALRPFYFVVHPDLFGQFPEQRVSLKRFVLVFLRNFNLRDRVMT